MTLFHRSLLSVLLLAAGYTAQANFASAIPSTLPGIPNQPAFRNMHLVEEIEGKGRLIRGQRITTRETVKHMVGLGVTDVLIFKSWTPPRGSRANQSRYTDVPDEVHALMMNGIPLSRIKHLDFPWRNLPRFKKSCEDTVEALQMALTILETEGRTLYFHCTVGEDRTGYLTALLEMLINQRPLEQAFDEDMCRRGYAHGNPNKPARVADAIQTEMTPLFLKMAYKIHRGFLTRQNLSADVCRFDPADDESFQSNPTYQSNDWHCRTRGVVAPVVGRGNNH